MSIIRGIRCRSTRPIVLPGGIVRRSTPGTLVSQRENLGRELFTVDFDTGQKVIVFAHEIELEHDEPSRRRPAIAAAPGTGSTASRRASAAYTRCIAERQAS